MLLAVSQWSCGSRPVASAVFTDQMAAETADAAVAGDAARLNRLIKDGSDPSAVGAKGTSLLQWAMLNQSPGGFESLLSAGADAGHADEAGDSVMHYAAMARDPQYLDILLKHRVDINVANTRNGRTPLMDALMAGRATQFDTLLAAGADPNRADSGGDRALHVAAQTNDFARALALLRAGADPAARNGQGATFQRYVFMTPTAVLSDDARGARDALEKWLREHHVELESDQLP
jgi:ankyrin repeat protein